MLSVVLLVSIESERNLPVLLVQAHLNSSTPSVGSPWMKWRSSRGSRWRRTCLRPARSWRAKWRMPTMSTRPTCFDKASSVVLSGLIKRQKLATLGFPGLKMFFVLFLLSDLLRRQEELRRMEEMHSQEMQKRKEMQLRYLYSAEFLFVVITIPLSHSFINP